MKFSAVLTSFILIVPLLAGEAFAVPQAKNNNQNNKGAANNKASSSAVAAAAANTSVAAAAAAAAQTSAAAANNGAAAANNAANNNNNGNNNNNNGNGNNNNNGNGNNNEDPQTSLTLDPKVIAPGFANDGQDVPVAGQVASLTSTNNFINFCLTVPDKPITNGQQIKTGSCNPAPMGIIAANTNMPASKFVVPVNGQDFPANQAFTIQMAINHLQTGNFVNAASNYYAAPQQINGAGDIIGHTHFTVQTIDSFTSTKPLDSSVFAFFKGVNGAAVNGIVSEPVANGLPTGNYRLCSMNTDANHAPALVAVAQHGFLDDCVYFTTGGGIGANPFNGGNNAAAGNGAAANNGTAVSAAPPAAASTAAAAAGAGKANNGNKNNNNKGNNNRNKKGGRRNRNGGRRGRGQARFGRN